MDEDDDDNDDDDNDDDRGDGDMVEREFGTGWSRLCVVEKDI